MFAEEEVVKSHLSRVRDITIAIIGIFLILSSRIAYLQIIQGEKLKKYSLENRLRENVLWAPRGKIYSRNYKVIVDNKARFDVIITRQDLKNPKQTIKLLSEISDLTVEEIQKKVVKHRYDAKYKPILIKRNISKREIALIETRLAKLPGVSVVASITRQYLNQEVGAHLLGYISEVNKNQIKKIKKRDNFNYRLGDFIGQRGVEEEFDLLLRGTNGREYLQVDAFGRKRKSMGDQIYSDIKDVAPLPGGKLILTIDQELQNLAYSLLKDLSAGVVMMDVETGEILSMVSTPSFRPSEFSSGLDPDYWKSLLSNKRKPLRDKVIQDHYAPGSTYKVITAFAGLAEGLITPQTNYFCDGGMKLGRRTYRCWNKSGHGNVDLNKAIRESCNVFFQRTAMKLDIDTLSRYATLFGLGKKTGIQLNREVSGLIPTKKWKEKNRGRRWTKGETLSCSIGQSYVLTTVLQLASMYAAIANNGKLLKPKIIKEAYNRNGELIESLKVEKISDVQVEQSHLDIVKKGLFEVVNHPNGTAHRSYIKDDVFLAGKTGTSQVVSAPKNQLPLSCDETPYQFKHNALFAGFAPYNNPKIAIAAIVEHGCGGSRIVPMLRKLVQAYLEKYHKSLYESNKLNRIKILRNEI